MIMKCVFFKIDITRFATYFSLELFFFSDGLRMSDRYQKINIKFIFNKLFH